jgi:hypothetical protein
VIANGEAAQVLEAPGRNVRTAIANGEQRAVVAAMRMALGVARTAMKTA